MSASFSSFNTLAEAQAYEKITYRTIPTSEALQFFLSKGVEDSLHSRSSDTMMVDVGGTNISVGSICRGVLQNSTGFNVDPSTPMGQFNLGVISILVAINIITQTVANEFISLGQTITLPYENRTEHDFQVSKGTISSSPVRLSANGDYAIIEIATNTPSHQPRLTTASGVVVSNFFNVSLAGEYVCQIPNQYRGVALFVDNAYSSVI